MLVEERIAWVDFIVLSSQFFTIAYAVRSQYMKLRNGYHTMRCNKNISGTGVRLQFPSKMKFHTESCPRLRGMILIYNDNVISYHFSLAVDAAVNVISNSLQRHPR